MAKIIQFKSKEQLKQEVQDEIEHEWLAFLEWERQMIEKNQGKTEREIFGVPDEMNDMKF